MQGLEVMQLQAELDDALAEVERLTGEHTALLDAFWKANNKVGLDPSKNHAKRRVAEQARLALVEADRRLAEARAAVGPITMCLEAARQEGYGG